MSAAPPIPAADSTQPDPQQSAPLCEICRYDLRGNQSGICPECGTPFVADLTGLPWIRRAELGTRRAFLFTVWGITLRPGRLLAAANGNAEPLTAWKFRRMCISRAVLALPVIVLFVGRTLGVGNDSSLFLNLLLPAACWYFMTTYTLGMSGLCRPGPASRTSESTALALADYATAPLALLPLAPMIGLAITSLSTNGNIDVPASGWITGGLAIAIFIWHFILTLRLMAELGATPGRVAITAVLGFPAAVSLCGLCLAAPGAVVYVATATYMLMNG